MNKNTYLPFTSYWLNKYNGLVYTGVYDTVTHCFCIHDSSPFASEGWDKNFVKKNFRKLPRAVGWHIQYQCPNGYYEHLKPHTK